MDSGQRFPHPSFPLYRDHHSKTYENPAISLLSGQSNRAMDYQNRDSDEGSSRFRGKTKVPAASSSKKFSRDEGSWRSNPIQSMETSMFRPPRTHTSQATLSKQLNWNPTSGEPRKHPPLPSSLTEQFGLSHQYPSFAGGSGASHNGGFYNPLAAGQSINSSSLNLSSSSYGEMPRPLPAAGTSQVLPLHLAKPKPRKSRQGEFQAGLQAAQHMFAMPPPIAEFPQPVHVQHGKEKMPKEPKKGGKISKAKMSTGKSGVSVSMIESRGPAVNVRWRAVEDTHHTRLIDLIKL